MTLAQDRRATTAPAVPRQDRYDVVVIGAGIAGLTAGALLAQAGKSVLVVEADSVPGGYAHAMQEGSYTFDRADHLITACTAEGPFGQGVVDAVLSALGVRDQCEFMRVDQPFYAARYPDLEIAVPAGREAFVEAHARRFPGEEAGLRRLVDLSARIYREVLTFPLRPRPQDFALMPIRWPLLFRYANATLRQVVEGELRHPRLRSVYETLWGWIGVPPSQASFLMWATMMALYVEDGPYYCRGSYQHMAEAFVTALVRDGGELLLGAPAAHIGHYGGRVVGVELEDGARISTQTVVAAIDARTTFEQLLTPGSVSSRFSRRLRRMELSPSAYGIYVGTDLDARALGAAHDTNIGHVWDPERAYVDGLAGKVPAGVVVIPTLTDTSLAPAGEHIVIVQALAARDSGETLYDEAATADRLLGLGEEVLPGLRDHLTFVEPAAGGEHPRVHRLGPIYGWALTPSQSGPRRLAQRTPLHGLLLAGQWTRPAPGIFSVVESGLEAARMTLGAPAGMPVLPLALEPRAPVTQR